MVELLNILCLMRTHERLNVRHHICGATFLMKNQVKTYKSNESGQHFSYKDDTVLTNI